VIEARKNFEQDFGESVDVKGKPLTTYHVLDKRKIKVFLYFFCCLRLGYKLLSYFRGDRTAQRSFLFQTLVLYIFYKKKY
jgi:hypothetical protein